MRFVAGVAGRRKRYGLDHRAIFGRLLVKIDHRKEIRRDVSLGIFRNERKRVYEYTMVVLVSRIAMVVSPTAVKKCDPAAAMAQCAYSNQTRS